MHDDAPDYADMLKRYIAHVKICTSYSHLDILTPIEFTDYEMQFLHMFERDADRIIEKVKSK